MNFNESMDDYVRKYLKIIKEDDQQAADQNADASAPVDKQTDNGENKTDNGENSEENTQEFHATSVQDFIDKTKTDISVNREKAEPSPIFGPNDLNNHNKYTISISNENGNVNFVFWDSIANTKNNKPLTNEDAFHVFMKNLATYDQVKSLDDFKKSFNYDKTDDNRAQDAYAGCQKMVDSAMEMFKPEQIAELLRLEQEKK